MIAPRPLAHKREMMDESPCDKDVPETEESSPTRPQSDDQQNLAHEIREEREEERSMRPNSDRVGKVRHELRPVRRLLFQSVPQKERNSRAHPQYRKTGLCPLRNKPHQQNVFYACHFDSSVGIMMAAPKQVRFIIGGSS